MKKEIMIINCGLLIAVKNSTIFQAAQIQLNLAGTNLMLLKHYGLSGFPPQIIFFSE